MKKRNILIDPCHTHRNITIFSITLNQGGLSLWHTKVTLPTWARHQTSCGRDI